MTERSKYEKLDDVGIIGTQERRSAASKEYDRKKTGEIFRKARTAAKTSSVKRRPSKSRLKRTLK